MSPSELFADPMRRNLEVLKMTLADFSDADMLVRPVPHANHAAWQVGHLAVSEARMMGGYSPSVAATLPAEFAERFTKETTKSDDPKAFPGKAALLDQFEKTRSATIAWVQTLAPADLKKPGPERMSRMAPTLGDVLGLALGHVMMHTGQIQVIRRKLEKPILF